MPELKSLTFYRGMSSKNHEDEKAWLNLFMHSLFRYSLIVTRGMAQGTPFYKGIKKCMDDGGNNILGKLFEVCLL